jgi:lyso-ornithine lipid O-acyltransferase
MASPSIGRANLLGKARLGIRVAILIFVLAICVPFHLLWRLLRLPSPWPRWFLAEVAWVCGAMVENRGTPLRHNVFYVVNHISWIDVPVLASLTGAAFVAQAPMADWPLIGWLAKLNHTVFVSRTDLLSVDTQIAELRAALDEKQPVAIFPEGTTTDGRSLLPFKKSLFEVVVPPPRPMMIQPVLLDFGDVAPDIAWIGEESFPDNAVRVLSRPGVFTVRVHFLEPFDPGDHADRKAIAAAARQRIADALSASLGGLAIV